MLSGSGALWAIAFPQKQQATSGGLSIIRALSIRGFGRGGLRLPKKAAALLALPLRSGTVSEKSEESGITSVITAVAKHLSYFVQYLLGSSIGRFCGK